MSLRCPAGPSTISALPVTIPTLRAYILTETDSPFLTVHRRDGAGFQRETLSGPDAILALPETGIAIPLADLENDLGEEHDLAAKMQEKAKVMAERLDGLIHRDSRVE